MGIGKEKTVVILQPSYLPWLGYFEQMWRADVFVIYDDVQFDKHGWRNRNRIKGPGGWQWLTVPVLTKGQNKPTNREIKIDNKINWNKKHIRSIYQNYSKAPYFKRYFPIFEENLLSHWEYLIDLNMALIYKINSILGLKREILFSSELNVEGDRLSRLVNICLKLGGTTFYEGESGKNYIDEKIFREAGIKLEYQHYKHPHYPQLYGEFIPYLSVIDLIFNCGEKSLDIIISQR